MRADFTLEMPPGGSPPRPRRAAPRGRPPGGRRARSPRKATSRLRSLVDCESTVSTSSAIGCPCGAPQPARTPRADARARAPRAHARGAEARVGAAFGPCAHGSPRYPPRCQRSASTEEIDGCRLLALGPPARIRRSAALYLHGVPSSSDEWTPFLERSGGIAVDLPVRPQRQDRIARVDRGVHAWVSASGAPGARPRTDGRARLGRRRLAFAQRLPRRVERLVVINAVPSCRATAGTARRASGAPGLGELAMARPGRFTLRQLSRESNATPGRCRRSGSSRARHFDQGTQRAILRLYRSSPPRSSPPPAWTCASSTCRARVWG